MPLLPIMILLAFALIVGTVSAEPQQVEPVRMSAAAFGTQAEIEVRGLPREEAVAAARDALREIFDLSQLFDPSGSLAGGLGALNAAAGGGVPLELEGRVGDLLRHGLQFCLWTNGAHGPLGGELYRLWNEQSKDQFPDPTELRDAVISATCNRIALTFGETGIHGEVAAGSRLEAVWMGRGFALDRAADVLRAAGVSNAWLEIGAVWKAMGGGPDGEGWLATLPPAPGTTEPVDRIWLRDKALAIASIAPVGGEPPARLIDQRDGVPPRGIVTVVTVTELAVDAEAMTATLFVAGFREGQMRLGGLVPRPSVFWLLGEGKGTPIESTYRWSELDRVKRRY